MSNIEWILLIITGFFLILLFRYIQLKTINEQVRDFA